jgi:hypothetical protein
MTRKDLVEYIKRKLGDPTFNVELTDEQYHDAIDDALEEINPWCTVFRYVTLDVTGSVIDLTKYNVADVTDVIKVMAGGGLAMNSSISNLGSSQLDMNFGGTVIPQFWSSTYQFENAVTRFEDISRVTELYIQSRRERLYNQFANMAQAQLLGTLYENVSWKYYDDKLYIDTCVPPTNIVTIEYIPVSLEVEDINQKDQFYKHMKDLAVAFAQLVQARVTGKYQIANSPTSINFTDMRNDANKEIDRIREELRTNINRFYITD